jgi:hypothetical protein
VLVLFHRIFHADTVQFNCKVNERERRDVPADPLPESSSLFALQGSGNGLWEESASDAVAAYRDEWT